MLGFSEIRSRTSFGYASCMAYSIYTALTIKPKLASEKWKRRSGEFCALCSNSAARLRQRYRSLNSKRRMIAFHTMSRMPRHGCTWVVQTRQSEGPIDASSEKDGVTTFEHTTMEKDTW